MRIFLTSSPCSPYIQEDGTVLYGYSEENGFLKRLAEGWNPRNRCLMISSDPCDFQRNDRMKKEFQEFFRLGGIPVADFVMCDERNSQEVSRLLKQCEIVILSGGHVPTQNEFFNRIHLREEIRAFNGIVMGISAGTMNSADVVYAQPELEGESVDPEYKKFLTGLGLTGLQILPHYQEVKDHMLDGRRLMEDITYGDSMGREFLVLVDGSYVLIENGKTVLYGEAYVIKDGNLKQICEKENVLDLQTVMEQV